MVLISLTKRKRYYSPKRRSSNSVQQLERVVFILSEHWAALQPFIGFLAVGLIIAPGGWEAKLAESPGNLIRKAIHKCGINKCLCKLHKPRKSKILHSELLNFFNPPTSLLQEWFYWKEVIRKGDKTAPMSSEVNSSSNTSDGWWCIKEKAECLRGCRSFSAERWQDLCPHHRPHSTYGISHSWVMFPRHYEAFLCTQPAAPQARQHCRMGQA